MIINSIPITKIDLTIPPEQLVVNLINNDNGTTFSSDQLKFDVPILTPKNKHNSKVKVSATPTSRFTGSTYLNYNRIDFNEVAVHKEKKFEITQTQLKISDLITEIDARFNLKLTSADYIDGPLPQVINNNEGVDEFYIHAANESLVYINKLKIYISIIGQILLSKVLKKTILNGLHYNEPVLHALISDE